MAPSPKKQSINFKYQKTGDFKTIQAHGAYGGITVRGQLNINFYVETTEFPKMSTAAIIESEAGLSLGPETFPNINPNEKVVLRELHFGINLDLDTVRKTANWMLKHADEYEASLKANERQTHKNE